MKAYGSKLEKAKFMKNHDENKHKTIELPWTLKMNLFYRSLAVITFIVLITQPIFEYFRFFQITFVFLIPISLAFIIPFTFIRSLRCSEEGVTLTRGFIWARSISWENIKSVKLEQTIIYVKRVPSKILVLTIQSNNNLKFKITSSFFKAEDIGILDDILAKKATHANLDLNLDPVFTLAEPVIKPINWTPNMFLFFLTWIIFALVGGGAPFYLFSRYPGVFMKYNLDSAGPIVILAFLGTAISTAVFIVFFSFVMRIFRTKFKGMSKSEE